MLAVKFHEDFYYSNNFYAKLGGIPVLELNTLEVQFMLIVDFELHVSEKDYQRHLREILETLDGHAQEQYLKAMTSEENTSVSSKFSISSKVAKSLPMIEDAVPTGE